MSNFFMININMMETSDVKTAFVRLKPKCDIFLSEPSNDTLTPLIKEYQELQANLLQEIHAYLLFPYTVHLRNPLLKSTQLKMDMVDAMNIIFSRTRVDGIEMYFKFLTVMIFQKFEKDPTDLDSIDEDFALSVIRLITTLTLRIPHDLRLQLYTRTHATKLGQGIFICVQLARKERFKALRLASIQCILAICTLHDDLMGPLHTPKLNRDLAEPVGDVLMFFLPGLLGAMQDIAKGEQKQGHAITCLAIKTISRVLCLTLMDKDEDQNHQLTNADFINLIETNNSSEGGTKEKSDPFGMKLRAKGVEGIKEHLEKAERNGEWYNAAGEKLTILMKSLLPIQYHPHERVRKEAAIMCSNVLIYSPRNMTLSLKYVLEMLIALSEDETEEITEISRKALENFTENGTRCNQKHLLDILEDNFNNMLTKLPRYLNKLDVNLQLCGIHLVKGYIRLLTNTQASPQRLSKILNCTHVMNRFAIILVEVFKLECSSIKLLEEFTIRDVETPVLDNSPWKIYTYLQNDVSVKQSLEICKILGISDSTEIIVDYLLEQYRLDNEFKKEIILILNEILSASCEETDKTDHLTKNVILTYIDYENWYLPTVVEKKEKPPGKNETFDISVYNPREWVKDRTLDLYEGATEIRYTDISYRQNESNCDGYYEDGKDSCRTLAQAQNNVIQICLMTEGIGKIAKSMKIRFQPYLLKTLYLILERAGSSIEAIHLAGIKALTDIAQAFTLKDITELIKTNADYFTHHVNIKLRKITDNAGVLDVLLVVMRYSEAEVLPCLYEIVSNILDHCSGPYFQWNMNLFLKLFYTFIKYISSKFCQKNQTSENPSNEVNCTEKNSILSNLKEFKKNLDVLKQLDKPNDCDENDIDLENVDFNIEEENNGDEKMETPVHIKMTISVLKKTMNFIPSNNHEQKVLALDIINEGVMIIKDFEDELLPLVHRVWSPLVYRFKETSHPLIVNRSFKLLITLANVSKDFIQRRTLKEVLPSLCDFLTKTSKDSLLKDIGSSYRFTQSYKLQVLLLEKLATLCISLNVHEKTLYEVMYATQVYLSVKQPKPLQELCVGFFKAISSYDVGACWLHLQGLWNEGRINSHLEDVNTTSLNKLKFPVCDALESKDYKRNVCALLEYLDTKD
ncbi:telo2 interacting protein 1 isoform X2 [Arctopsyche grandis]|uniref:telo2 interacting protein 1 isoform X2 n=1 Tax=Arctopsyche grandis TaxID=121162 RepID=UPI00406D7B05